MSDEPRREEHEEDLPYGRMVVTYLLPPNGHLPGTAGKLSPHGWVSSRQHRTYLAVRAALR